MERRESGLGLFQSNHFETLLSRLLTDLSEGGGDPFQPEAIIVPSTAVRRVVEERYADEFCVAANLQFDFLARWVWGRIGEALPKTRESPLRNPRLLWQVYRAFGEPEFRTQHPRLAHYLERADSDPVMRFELAGRVAGIYQRCLPWREDWIKRWSRGDSIGLRDFADEDWLAALWRWLARELALPEAHPATAFMEVLATLEPQARQQILPARLSVFCPAELPPLYLDLLRQLARFIRIRVYLFNPCRHYWSLIVKPQRLARLEVREQAQYYEVGHPLLASWGQETQGVFAQIERLDDVADQADEHFVERKTTSLLAWLQNDILELGIDPPQHTGVEGNSTWLPEADSSLEIHVCHSFTRQLEVLHDRLLARFDADSTLRLSDVVVVMPDLESRAPLIDAVFGSVPRERMIPYRITGLQGRTANPAVEVLLALFALFGSRCRASEVFAVLRHRMVALRLGLSGEQLDAIHDWMRRSDMRWGLDAAHRQNFDQPADETCTLLEGLDRLFMGLAMPEDSTAWHGVLPVSEVEGSATTALGVLWQFIDHLRGARSFVTQPRSAAVWEEFCTTWVDRLLPDHRECVDDVRAARETLRQHFEELHTAQLGEPLPFSVLLASLTEAFEAGGRAALIGPVLSFAPMNAMRFLPFRIVCVLGLEEDAFPSGGRFDEFDPMGIQPRLGDPAPRLAARNLFLDLLLAARDQLYLSYTGRGIRDDEPLPPSIVISDLLDCIVSRWSPSPNFAEVRQRLEIQHPLQAFSWRYFEGDSRLFSHVTEYAEGLSAAATGEAGKNKVTAGETRTPGFDVFCPEPLTPVENAQASVSLDQLSAFLGNPSRHFLQQRLGIRFGRLEEELRDDEPDSVGNSPLRALARRLFPLLMGGADEEALLREALAGREYPPDAIGRVRIAQVIDTVQELRARHAALVGDGLPTTLYFEHQFAGLGDDLTLGGVIGEITPAGRMVVLPTSCYSDRLLNAWVFHLALQAASEKEDSAVLPSFVLSAERYVTHQEEAAAALDKKKSKEKSMPWVAIKVFKPVPAPDALKILEHLLRLYREGLTRPLPFFPRAAQAFAKALNKKPGPRTKKSRTPEALLDSARKEALKKWEPDYSGAGPEREDVWHALVIQGCKAPLDGQFEALATEIFLPLLEYLSEDPDAMDDGDEA